MGDDLIDETQSSVYCGGNCQKPVVYVIKIRHWFYRIVEQLGEDTTVCLVMLLNARCGCLLQDV